MKKITMLLGMVVASTVGFSQIIFDITSAPTCTSLEKTWNFTIASSDGTQAGWGASPNMFVGTNSITAEMVMVDDGTTLGDIDANGNSPHDKTQDACDSTTWTQDLTGKIAVCFRGACEFGLKSFNAQKRGAIAVVIINHTGDPIAMGGGTFGPQVTIPVIMLSETDGNQVAACLNGGGTATAFLGSKVGLYPNDMGTSSADIVMTENAATPALMTDAYTDIALGLWAYNLGQNTLTDVVGSVGVKHIPTGTMVYYNESAPVTFNAPDTSFVDTQYIDLGTIPGMVYNGTPGEYEILYNVSASQEDEASDNTVKSSFWITENNVFSKSRVDGSYDPIHTTAFSLNESTTTYADFETCIQFRSSNASAMKAMGMTFSCEPVGQTMANQIVEVRAYTWNDVFTDANDPAFPTAAGPGPWSLTQVGGEIYFYFDESQDGANIYLPFQEAPIDMTDNQRYLFCVYNASDSLRIGFDAQINYESTVNQYLEYSSPVKTLAQGGSDEWYAVGFGYDVSTAVTVNFDQSPTAIEEANANETVVAYPNPVANLLNVPVRKGVAGNVQIEVFDLAGKQVLAENAIAGNGPLRINVASIANGSYMFRLTFADGSQDSFKVSVNR